MSNKSFTQQNKQIAKSLVERQKIRSSEKYRMLNTYKTTLCSNNLLRFVVFHK